jgi:hypothetical protein
MAAPTRISVASARGEWAVRKNGLTLFREQTKAVAVSDARRLARVNAPAELLVQNQHGAWRTEATY